MVNHPNANRATDRLIEAFDYYVCSGPYCDIVCDLMTIDLKAARKRLCVKCLFKSMKF